MKQTYIPSEIEVIKFTASDVIETSGTDDGFTEDMPL